MLIFLYGIWFNRAELLESNNNGLPLRHSFLNFLLIRHLLLAFLPQDFAWFGKRRHVFEKYWSFGHVWSLFVLQNCSLDLLPLGLLWFGNNEGWRTFWRGNYMLWVYYWRWRHIFDLLQKFVGKWRNDWFVFILGFCGFVGWGRITLRLLFLFDDVIWLDLQIVQDIWLNEGRLHDADTSALFPFCLVLALNAGFLLLNF